MKLERYILNHAIASIGKALIFQQDNDPELTVNAVKAHVDTKKINKTHTQNGTLSIMDWLPQSCVRSFWQTKEQKAAKIQRNLGHIK